MAAPRPELDSRRESAIPLSRISCSSQCHSADVSLQNDLHVGTSCDNGPTAKAWRQNDLRRHAIEGNDGMDITVRRLGAYKTFIVKHTENSATRVFGNSIRTWLEGLVPIIPSRTSRPIESGSLMFLSSDVKLILLLLLKLSREILYGTRFLCVFCPCVTER